MRARLATEARLGGAARAALRAGAARLGAGGPGAPALDTTQCAGGRHGRCTGASRCSTGKPCRRAWLGLMLRERDCAPVPHDLVHVDQALKARVTQSTGQFAWLQLRVSVARAHVAGVVLDRARARLRAGAEACGPAEGADGAVDGAGPWLRARRRRPRRRCAAAQWCASGAASQSTLCTYSRRRSSTLQSTEQVRLLQSLRYGHHR